MGDFLFVKPSTCFSLCRIAHQIPSLKMHCRLWGWKCEILLQPFGLWLRLPSSGLGTLCCGWHQLCLWIINSICTWKHHLWSHVCCPKSLVLTLVILQGSVSSYQQVILTLPINQPASHHSECKGLLAVCSKTCLCIWGRRLFSASTQMQKSTTSWIQRRTDVYIVFLCFS